MALRRSLIDFLRYNPARVVSRDRRDFFSSFLCRVQGTIRNSFPRQPMAEISSETRFLHAIEMGLGAWQWGDRIVWQYGHGYSDREVKEAFLASLSEGIRFVDTAEIYGNGRSEQLLGQFLKEIEQPVLIATKFLPFPWRFGKNAFPRALKNSLGRIGVESVDLYQIHWPTPLMSIDTMMDGLSE